MSTSTPIHKTTEPLILITNDDGIASPGLQAAVRAVLPLGEVLVAAPTEQWSGAGRSMPHNVSGRISPYPLEVDGQAVTAYQIDASPALAVGRALLVLTPRRPALLISGINYGENMGADVTSSGTVGAALQGAASGIPALAVSLQTPKETHTNPSDDVDFAAAVHFARVFAGWMLRVTFPFDVDVLKVDIPAEATPQTPWRLTRVSRHTYFVGVPPEQTGAEGTSAPAIAGEAGEDIHIQVDYQQLPHPERTETDSDIYALAVERVVSVTPLSLDLTSRSDLAEVEALLCGPAAL